MLLGGQFYLKHSDKEEKTEASVGRLTEEEDSASFPYFFCKNQQQHPDAAASLPLASIL